MSASDPKPKPKAKGKEKGDNQVLSILLPTEVVVQLDQLLEKYGRAEKDLPLWFKVPDSRTALIRHLVSRSLGSDSRTLDSLIEEHESQWQSMNHQWSDLGRGELETLSAIAIRAGHHCRGDEYFSAMRESFKKVREDRWEMPF